MSEPLAKLAWEKKWDALDAGLRAGRDPNDPMEFYDPSPDGFRGNCPRKSGP